jgi:hypothetical protein
MSSTVAQNPITTMVIEKSRWVPKNSFFKPPTNISKNTIKTFINHLPILKHLNITKKINQVNKINVNCVQSIFSNIFRGKTITIKVFLSND